jgi:L-amino acid N-acyltransferase YncA
MATLIIRKINNAEEYIVPTDRLMQLPADYWENRLQRKNRHNLVAIKDKKIIGIVSWGPNRQADSQTQNGELMSIYVLPECQGKGLEKKLLFKGRK